MNKLYVWFKMNKGLFNKIGFYIGLPSLLFMLVVLYLVSSGGISNYTIAGFNAKMMVSSSVMQSTRLIVGAILFVILPVFISVMAIVRKSMSYKIAAMVVNFVAVIFISAALNPTGNVSCSGRTKRSGGETTTTSGGYGTENSVLYCNPDYACDEDQCISSICYQYCSQCMDDSGNCTNWDNECAGVSTASDTCAANEDSLTCQCKEDPESDPRCACILYPNDPVQCPDPFSSEFNTNFDCPQIAQIQDIIKQAEEQGLSFTEAWAQAGDLVAQVASCPIDHLNAKDFIEGVCGDMERELTNLHQKTGIAPVRIGLNLEAGVDKEITPDTDRFKQLKEGSGSMVEQFKAYATPTFQYNIGINNDYGAEASGSGDDEERKNFWTRCSKTSSYRDDECRYYTNFARGTYDKNGVWSAKGNDNCDVTNDYNCYFDGVQEDDGKSTGKIIDDYNSKPHDLWLSCNGNDNCDPFGDAAVSCAMDATTGFSINMGEKELAYTIAVFKPWKRKPQGACNLNSISRMPNGADSYAAITLTDERSDLENIQVCNKVTDGVSTCTPSDSSSNYTTVNMQADNLYNCDSVKSLNEESVYYVPFIAGSYCNIPDMPIHNVATYYEKAWRSSIHTSGDLNDNTRYEGTSNSRSSVLSRLKDYSKTTGLGLKPDENAPAFPTLASSQVLPSGLFGINDVADATVTSGFEWMSLGANSGLSTYVTTCWNCAMPGVGAGIFIIDDDGKDGGKFNLNGVAIGGGQATRGSNQVLAWFALNMTTVDLLKAGSTSPLNISAIYKRTIDLSDYRSPIYTLRELGAKVDIIKAPLYPQQDHLTQADYDNGRLSAAEVLPDEQEAGGEIDWGNSSSFYYYSKRSTDTTHLQANFTGQLARLKKKSLADTNKAIADSGAINDTIAFDAGDKACLAKIANYINKHRERVCIGNLAGGLNEIIYGSSSRLYVDKYPCDEGEAVDLPKALIDAGASGTVNDVELAGEGLVMTGFYVATKMDWTLNFADDKDRAGKKESYKESVKANPGVFPGAVNIGFRELLIDDKSAKDKQASEKDPYEECRKNYGNIAGLNSKIKENSSYVPSTEDVTKSMTCDQYFGN